MEEIGCRRRNQNFKSGCYQRNCEFVTACQKQIANCNRQLEPSLKDLVLNPKSNKISRPPNAFMIYAREHRKLLALKYPKENNKNISSMLGESWKKIDPSIKIQYFEKAKMLEELHKKRYPGYVYSPRVARMQKLERNKKRGVLKCYGRINHKEGRNSQPIEHKKNFDECDEKDEWVEEQLMTKLSSTEYVPNNPQYFSESEPMSKACENISQLEPENHGYSGFPPPPWHAMQNNTLTTPYTERCCDAYEVQPGVHPGQQYRRPTPRRTCNCEVCGEYRDQINRSSANTFKSTPYSGCPCSADCSSLHVTSHQTPEPSSFVTLSSPSFHDFKSPRPLTSCEHSSTNSLFPSSFPYACGQNGDCKPIYFPRPPLPWATPPSFDSPSCCYQDMNYFCNRNQEYLKNYYSSFPYPTPSPGVMHHHDSFNRSLIKLENPDSKGIPHSNESSNQEYESNELHSSDTEILNIDDADIDEDGVLSQVPENNSLEQTHLDREQTLQQM